jgi:hypothetical protein
VQTAAVTDFSYKPTVTGDLVVLRPLDEGDYDAIRAAIDDPDVTRLTGSHGDVDEQKAREWMRTRKDQRRATSQGVPRPHGLQF